MRKTKPARISVFLFAAGLHGLLILFFAPRIGTAREKPEPVLPVMKLTGIREEPPPPPPEKPPEPAKPPEPRQSAPESAAETMIETEDAPPPVTADPAPPAPGSGEEEYFPMHRVSTAPVFSEEEITRAVIYPVIARRSVLDGMVYLELFIDKEGWVRNIKILKEEPEGKGFGEAAVRAFSGLRAVPARANGVPVGVRYRYPVRFRIRG
ncbi:MAG: TonB family protein [Spirochaetaceae bacterium]|jgi:protein TonB|nr:TonB family protein [Spirochaetaceae bacterium]